jgi:HEAT repeat protein
MEEKMSLVTKLKMRFSKQEGLEDLLSMSEHWDGYKRENAVRRLGMLGNPLAIQKLLVRVNDWVPEVRDAARESILKLAVTDNTEAFIHYLPDLYHLRTCGRGDHRVFIEAIEAFLSDNESSNFLIQGLDNEDPLVVRHCMSLIIRHDLLATETIVQKCLDHSDVVVRVRASGLLRKLNGEILESVLSKALIDRFMPIRREAFQIAIRHSAYSKDLPEKYLFDRHPSIRGLAIRFLVKNGVDVKTIYLRNIKSLEPKILRCVIWGLGELNCSESISSIKGFLNNSHPSVRKQTINSLAKLMEDGSSEILISCLGDDSSAVCKEAARLLSKHGVTFTCDQLLVIIERSGHKHTLDTCFGIARRINKWERLVFIASLFDERYRTKFRDVDQLRNSIRQWDDEFNRSYSQPTKDQLSLLCKKFRGVKELKANRSIAFTLKSYGINI